MSRAHGQVEQEVAQAKSDFAVVVGASFKKEAVLAHLGYFFKSVNQAFQLKIGKLPAGDQQPFQNKLMGLANFYRALAEWVLIANPSKRDYFQRVAQFHEYGCELLKQMGYPKFKPLQLHQLMIPLYKTPIPAGAPIDNAEDTAVAITVANYQTDVLTEGSIRDIKAYIEYELNRNEKNDQRKIKLGDDQAINFCPSHLTKTVGLRNLRRVDMTWKNTTGMSDGEDEFFDAEENPNTGDSVTLYGSGSFVPYKLSKIHNTVKPSFWKRAQRAQYNAEVKQNRLDYTKQNVAQVANYFRREGYNGAAAHNAAINISLITPTQPSRSDQNVRSTHEMVTAFREYDNDSKDFHFFDFYLGVNQATYKPVMRAITRFAAWFLRNVAKKQNRYENPLQRNKQSFANLIAFLAAKQQFSCLNDPAQPIAWDADAGSGERNPITQLAQHFQAIATNPDYAEQKRTWKARKQVIQSLLNKLNQHQALMLQSPLSAEQLRAAKALAAFFTACEHFFEEQWFEKNNRFILQSSLLAVAHYTKMAPLTNCKSGEDRTRDALAHAMGLTRLADELAAQGKLLDLHLKSHRQRLNDLAGMRRNGLPAMDINKSINVTKKTKLKDTFAKEVSKEEKTIEGLPKTTLNSKRDQQRVAAWLMYAQQHAGTLPDIMGIPKPAVTVLDQNAGVVTEALDNGSFPVTRRLLHMIKGEQARLDANGEAASGKAQRLSTAITKATHIINQKLTARNNNNDEYELQETPQLKAENVKAQLEQTIRKDKEFAAILLEQALLPLMEKRQTWRFATAFGKSKSWSTIEAVLDELGVNYEMPAYFIAPDMENDVMRGYVNKPFTDQAMQFLFASVRRHVHQLCEDFDDAHPIKRALAYTQFGGENECSFADSIIEWRLDLSPRDYMLFFLKQLRFALMQRQQFPFLSKLMHTAEWKSVLALLKSYNISDEDIQRFNAHEVARMLSDDELRYRTHGGHLDALITEDEDDDAEATEDDDAEATGDDDRYHSPGLANSETDTGEPIYESLDSDDGDGDGAAAVVPPRLPPRNQGPGEKYQRGHRRRAATGLVPSGAGDGDSEEEAPPAAPPRMRVRRRPRPQAEVEVLQGQLDQVVQLLEQAQTHYEALTEEQDKRLIEEELQQLQAMQQKLSIKLRLAVVQDCLMAIDTMSLDTMQQLLDEVRQLVVDFQLMCQQEAEATAGERDPGLQQDAQLAQTLQRQLEERVLPSEDERPDALLNRFRLMNGAALTRARSVDDLQLIIESTHTTAEDNLSLKSC